MRILLDSHALLWALYEPEKLSTHASSLIRSPQNTLVFSDASRWELSLKIAKGKLGYESSLSAFRRRVLEFGAQTLAITDVHIQLAVTLPPHHADPFDRMLIAQSRIENLPLLTSDRNIARYDVHRIW